MSGVRRVCRVLAVVIAVGCKSGDDGGSQAQGGSGGIEGLGGGGSSGGAGAPRGDGGSSGGKTSAASGATPSGTTSSGGNGGAVNAGADSGGRKGSEGGVPSSGGASSSGGSGGAGGSATTVARGGKEGTGGGSLASGGVRQTTDGGAAGLAGQGGASEPTCNAPAPRMVPGSDTNQTYAMAVAQSSRGVGVVWSSWPQGGAAQFSLYDPAKQTFGTPKRMPFPIGLNTFSARNVAVTTLPDESFAVAWVGGSAHSVFLTLNADTDAPNTVSMAYDPPGAGTSVAVAPAFDGKIAVGWDDVAPDDPLAVRARALVTTFDPAVPAFAQYEMRVPDELTPSVRMYRAPDRLVVLLSVLDKVSASTLYVSASVYLAVLRAGDAPGRVSVKPLLERVQAYNPPFTFTDKGFQLAYRKEQTAFLADFDLDGNATGTPRPVLSPSELLDVSVLYQAGGGAAMLWLDPERALHFGQLDRDRQPTLATALLAPFKNVIPVGEAILDTPAGTLAAWRSAGGAAYLTPLCPERE